MTAEWNEAQRYAEAALHVLQAFRHSWALDWRPGLTKAERQALEELDTVHREDVGSFISAHQVREPQP